MISMSKKKYIKKFWDNEPRIIKAKFDSVCSETRERIKKGEECIYYPIEKRVFCMNSDQATEFFNMKADEDLGYNY